MRAHEILLELARTTVNANGSVISSSPEVIERFWNWFGNSKVKDRTGRPIVVYHGTDQDFRAFDPEKSNSNTNTGMPHGAFAFTDHPDVALSYTMLDADRMTFGSDELHDQFRELIRSGNFEAQMQFLHDHPQKNVPEFKQGGNVMPVYLRIMKPLRIDAKGYHWHDIYFQPKDYRAPESFTTNEIAEYAMDNGFDGVIIKNVKDVHKGPAHASTVYIVFSPNQIKSVMNRGGYSRDAHEIDESL